MAENGSLERWLTLLLGERSRRGQDAEFARFRLTETIEAMSDRLRSSPDFREPDPDEQRDLVQRLEKWFKSHGYSLD